MRDDHLNRAAEPEPGDGTAGDADTHEPSSEKASSRKPPSDAAQPASDDSAVKRAASERTPGKSGGSTGKGFFRWLPWEKLTIWALFLFLVYTLREFFSVIFLTFIFSYIMTSIVGSVMRIISPNRENLALHRLLVVASFLTLLGSLYGLGYFLSDPLKEQIGNLKVQYRQLDLSASTLWDDLARNTVGKWRYVAIYDDAIPAERSREELSEKQRRYVDDFEKFREQQYHTEELRRFRERAKTLEEEFQRFIVEERGEEAYAKIVAENKEIDRLRGYMREHISPGIYEANKAQWDNEYETWYGVEFGTTGRFKSDVPTLAEHKADPEAFEIARREWAYTRIENTKINDEEEKKKLRSKLKEYLGQRAKLDLETSGKIVNEFERFYNNLPSLGEEKYTFEKFLQLRDALAISDEEFHKVLMEDKDPEDREAAIENSFKRSRQSALAAETLEEWKWLNLDEIKSKIQGTLPDLATAAVVRVGDLFQFVVFFALSLMLSFFITFDLPRIRKGIRRLGESESFKNFYHEIAPGLAAFGTLIGRAFQAQGVIAICNTLLTLGLIKILDIPFEIFLCTIVFFCSFIPVLGVIMSTVPIALVALVHKGPVVSVISVGGILLIHFIETSILNPKIVGEMMHLHPVLVLGILVIGEHFFHVWGLLLGVPIMVYIIRYVILNEPTIPVPAVAGAVERPPQRSKPPPERTTQEPASPKSAASAR